MTLYNGCFMWETFVRHTLQLVKSHNWNILTIFIFILWKSTSQVTRYKVCSKIEILSGNINIGLDFKIILERFEEQTTNQNYITIPSSPLDINTIITSLEVSTVFSFHHIFNTT